MRIRTSALILVFLAAASGCERGRPSPHGAAAIDPLASASADPATAASTPPPAPAAPPPPIPASAILRGAFAVEGGTRLPLAPGVEVVVGPSATFEVELSVRSPDARLVLVDAREDLVPATSSLELAAGTRLTLSPSAPLVPGSRNALRLDGATGRELHDGAGHAFSALTLPLLVAGSPPPPEEPKRSAKRKRRR